MEQFISIISGGGRNEKLEGLSIVTVAVHAQCAKHALLLGGLGEVL